MTSRIIVALEDEEFDSIDSYNARVLEELALFNRKPFQKKDGSRESLYLDFEKPILKKLPKDQYQVADWKTVKVQKSCHVALGNNYYSVPIKYVGKQVKLKIQKGTVIIYDCEKEIAKHKLFPKGRGQYSTVRDHFPKQTDKYRNWGSVKFLNWAKTKGPNIYNFMHSLFKNTDTEQAVDQSAQGIIALGEKYGEKRLDSAIKLASDRFE